MAEMKKTFLFLALTGMAAWADCVDGARNTTDAEKQFYTETHAALKALIPAAPAGWKLQDNSTKIVGAPGSVCLGSKAPMRVTYEVRYYWQDAIADLNQKGKEFDKKIADLRQLPADKQKEFDDLGRASRDLERESRKLKATDPAAAEQKMTESKEIWKKAREIRDTHVNSVMPQIQALTRERTELNASVNTEVRLTINVNGFNLGAPEGGEKMSVAGAALAMRGPKKTVVGFGPWTLQGRDIKAAYPAGETTKVRTATIEVTGEPKQIEPLLEAMNTASLQSMIVR